MTANVLVYDVGSTYTKVVAFDLQNDRLCYLGRGQSPTTLDRVMRGVQGAEAALAEQGISLANKVFRYATCSAAGGLRMVAMGYMPHVTAKAAKEVAMNAGARVLEVISHEDAPGYRLEILREIRPDLVLLAGGTDGGEAGSAVENARLIVESGASCLVVIACNKEAQAAVIEVLEQAAVSYVVAPNVMPTIHRLNVKAAREAIHAEFIKQLTRASGLDELVDLVSDHQVRPTPGAVLLAGELWARGTYRQKGLGNVILIDVGGATTDVHSVLPRADKMSSEELGLIINNEKQVSYRTVEGNLGLRVSATGILETVGVEELRSLLAEQTDLFAEQTDLLAEERASSGKGTEQRLQGNQTVQDAYEEDAAAYIQDYTREREKTTELLAASSREDMLDRALAVAAMRVALKRHAGFICQEYDPATGILPGFPVGRDLRLVKRVIGIGGIFANHDVRVDVAMMEKVLDNPGLSLLPTEADLLFDRHYLMFALGTLSLYYPDAVFRFMKSPDFSGEEVKAEALSDLPQDFSPVQRHEEHGNIHSATIAAGHYNEMRERR